MKKSYNCSALQDIAILLGTAQYARYGIGKGEVSSSILLGSTIRKFVIAMVDGLFCCGEYSYCTLFLL
ncbi:MAG: hypothetical protein FWC13_12820 [Oscillospiraceae bacterium]|nr:hypothetical protein [Oscillospiraceae bacterium]